MTNGQRILRVAMLTATLFSAQGSRGQDAGSWDGTWNGTLGKNYPLAHLGFDREREGRTEKGALFDVEFTKVTPTSVFFGDKAN